MISGAQRLARCAIMGALVTACSRDSEVRPDTSVSQPGPAAITSVAGDSAGRADDCPATGEWALCSVEKRLKRSGFVATRIESESPARAGFSVKPVVYTLGRGRLEVFIYDDAESMNRDMAGIDTLAVAPAGAAADWPAPPRLIRNGNLAAVYMDQTARQAERLEMALTAGAPSGR
jgi:hypothetical protein